MRKLNAIILSLVSLIIANSCLAEDVKNEVLKTKLPDIIPTKESIIEEKTTLNDTIALATKSWQKTGQAVPIKSNNGKITYPFDEKLPTLTCSPLHICDIELEPGEKVQNVAIGDQVRWILSPATSGVGANATPHVIIKPTDENISTNMVITTDLRTYYLYLTSKKTNYVTRINFYYPHNLVQTWNNKALVEKETELNKIAGFPSITAVDLDFNYDIKGKSSSIKPEKVFNDGNHTYLKMRDDIFAREVPILMVIGKNNEAELANYRVKNGYYIIDRLFEKAELILGVGREQEKVTITHKSKGNGFCLFNCKK